LTSGLKSFKAINITIASWAVSAARHVNPYRKILREKNLSWLEMWITWSSYR